MATVDVNPDELARAADALVMPSDPAAEYSAGIDPAIPAAVPTNPWAQDCAWLVTAGNQFLHCELALTEAERAAFADALAGVLEKVFPGGLGNPEWRPYYQLALVSAGIVMPRVAIYKRIKAEREAPPAAQSPTPPAPAGAG